MRFLLLVQRGEGYPREGHDRRLALIALSGLPIRSYETNMGTSPALMLKSMQYMDNTASQMVRTLF